MAGSELEFINRNEELAFLIGCLQRQPDSALIVLRSPPGFGKSRLTEQLSLRCRRELPNLLFCIVEPEIQVNPGAARVHDGFFLQRCAEQLSRMAETRAAPWQSMSEFLKSRKWKTVKEKKGTDWLAEAPGVRSAYKLLFDYASRTLSTGSFSPARLLSSDSHEAVRLCTEYAESVLEGNVVLVVRAAQHCDLQSLRTLLEWNESRTAPDMILEYTSRTAEFEPAHQKLILRLAGRKHFHILDMVRLGSWHLEHLIRTNVRSDFALETKAYLSWDGNLRSVIEMQFQVGIAHKVTNAEHMELALGDLASIVQSHVAALPPVQRMVLAVCAAHGESIPEHVLAQVLGSIVQVASPLLLKRALDELIDVHKFIALNCGAYGLRNEGVAQALLSLPSFRSLLAAAEKALRDHYADLVVSAAWRDIGFGAAVRQLFRLCARTHDVAGLLHVTEALSAEVSRAQDQSLYVEVVAAAVAAAPDLYAGDHDRLVTWAASLAYDIGSYVKAEQLLSMLSSPADAYRVMRACCLQEIGRHDEAMHLVADLRAVAAQDETRLAADLIDAMVRGCHGDHRGARSLLHRLLADSRHAHSPLLGYAHRFFEVTEGYAGSIDQLHQSIAWFARFGMDRSKAYSQAATAVLIARMGDVGAARTMIAQASEVLGQKVQDRHLLLNNMACIELLSPAPNYEDCIRLLTEALRYVRDDYCEITVLSNLSLAHSGHEHHGVAAECVEKVLHLLDDHDFASQEIYWPLCFNAAQVMRAAGQLERARDMMQLPGNRVEVPSQNKSYWAYRYGWSDSPAGEYMYLAARPYHPLYLSHWLIDLDGIDGLRRESQQ